MRELPHDGEAASIVRGKETGTFYLLNADLVHAYVARQAISRSLPNLMFQIRTSSRHTPNVTTAA